MSNPHDQKKLLESRRKVEDRIIAMENGLKDARTTLQKSQFEISTTNKIERRMKTEMLSKMQDDDKYQLFYRRQNLAALFNSELEGWKAEVLSKEETIEERKTRIMKRANALRDDREKARNEFVQQAYVRQWRDANDDSRTLNSDCMTKFMADERQKQMHDKMEATLQAGKDEGAFLAEWQRQLDVIEAKDKAKLAARHKANMDTQDGLRTQMSYNTNQKQKIYDQTQQEAEAEIAGVQKAIADEKERLEQKKRDAFQKGQDVLAYNATFKDIEADKAAREEWEDRFLLDHALEKERLEIQAEEDKKKGAAESARQYTAYLKMLMIKEAEDTGFVDEMNRREAEKVQKARDDALQAREDARNHLMTLVKEGRAEQIQHKREVTLKEKEDDVIYASKFAGDIKEGKLRDMAAAEARRQKAMANSVKLKQQIEQRENMSVILKQEEFLAEKRMKHMERLHKDRLQQQAGSVRLDYKRRVVDKL